MGISVNQGNVEIHDVQEFNEKNGGVTWTRMPPNVREKQKN